MSQTDKQGVGKLGEQEVVLFLKKQGYKILDQNYLKKWGEIDIVAQKQGIWHFIEVKTVVSRVTNTKDSRDYYEPEDNIHPWKRKRLGRVIQTYLLENKAPEEIDWQIDIAAVYLNERGEKLKIDITDDIIL